MIQRIQTVYLLLAAAAAILYNFLPLGVDETPDPGLVIYGKDILPIMAGSAGSAAIAIIAVFLYGNRNLQMLLCRFNIFLIFILIGLTAYFLFGDASGRIETPGIGLGLPVFMLVFNFLALRNIGSDEKLVRSMDRLR